MLVPCRACNQCASRGASRPRRGAAMAPDRPAQRDPVRGEVILFVLAAAFLALWTALSLQTMWRPGGVDIRVLGSFWAAGDNANRGLNPYGDSPLVPVVATAAPASPGVIRVSDRNLNPPAWLPICQLLALFDPARAAAVWLILTATIFAVGGFVLMADAPAPLRSWMILCLLVSTPVLDTIFLGQNYGILYLLGLVGWRSLQHGRPIAASAAIGMLAAIKPNLLMWPALLFLSGQRKIAVLASAAFAMLSAFPLFLYGFRIYPEWLQVMRGDTHWAMPADISLVAVARRLGVAPVGIFLAASLIVASAYLAWRTRPTKQQTTVLALCAAILGAPLAWGYYIVLLMPAMADGMWGGWGFVGGILSLLPIRYAPPAFMKSVWTPSLLTSIQLAPFCIVFVHAAWQCLVTRHDNRRGEQ